MGGNKFSESLFSFLFITKEDKELIKSVLVPRAGTLKYSLQPFLVANSLYSISNSTKVYECSDTKAMGTKTIFFPSFQISKGNFFF